MRWIKYVLLFLIILTAAIYGFSVRGSALHSNTTPASVQVYPSVYLNPDVVEASRFLVIDTGSKILTLYVDKKPFRSYPVAVGTRETPTPLGDFTVVHKDVGWGTGFGSRWIGLNVPWGTYGIHGTNQPWSIGRSASHGCIRMYNRHVEELYPLVPLGTPVYIINSYNPYPPVPGRTLRRGMIGQDVVYVQRRLQEVGLLWDKADGRYGGLTALAVAYLQFMYGNMPTGVVDRNTYILLGLNLY